MAEFPSTINARLRGLIKLYGLDAIVRACLDAAGVMGKGDPGQRGVDGVAGSPGATGATGPAGADGTNGTNGTDGATGATGATGAQGATGLTGSSGTGGGLGNFRKFSASTFSPVCLYNFQNDLTDSSGNGLDLVNNSSIASFRMLGMQTDGTPIYGVTASATGFLKRNTHDSSLTITGDITVQIIVAYTAFATASSTAEWIAFEGGDETSANNYLWAIIQNSGSPEAYWEHGSGTDVTYTPLTGNAGLRFAGIGENPVYWAWTRTSGVVQMYCDGKPWGGPSGALTAPDGGSTSTLRFFNKGSVGEYILGAKVSASALSAADIASEYNSTLGLAKGQV